LYGYDVGRQDQHNFQQGMMDMGGLAYGAYMNPYTHDKIWGTGAPNPVAQQRNPIQNGLFWNGNDSGMGYT